MINSRIFQRIPEFAKDLIIFEVSLQQIYEYKDKFFENSSF